MHPLAKDFYEYLKCDKSKRTAYNYSRNVDTFLKFVNKPIDEITPLDISKWYGQLRKKGYSDRTIWRYGWALRSFFDVMQKEELRRKTPIPKLEEIPEPKWLEEETTFKLIDRIPVLCVGYDLALRVGEVRFLRKNQLNLETGDITVTRLKHKGHRNTYILKLDKWCLEILKDYIKKYKDFIRETLFPMSVGTIQRIFRKRAKVLKTGEGYTFHSLRHSRITHIAIHQLEEKGVVDELSLAKFAGHLRVETTRTYVHLATKYLAFGRRI